ncbi:DNA primase [Streptomyces sp. NPDC054855]
MNRVGLGLAVGAGYVLGRTKKMKLAFAVGTMVAGKRMNLSPRALGDLLSQQLQNNPQFKEIGDQLREDMRGVGKAATGALVERQISGLADRLHGRTADVRDQLSGVTPDIPGRGTQEDEEEPDDAYEEYDGEDDRDERDHEESAEAESDEEPDERPRPRKKAPAQKAAPKKEAAKKTPARKTAAKKSPAKKTAKKAPARAAAKTSARRATGARLPKEGGRDE